MPPRAPYGVLVEPAAAEIGAWLRAHGGPPAGEARILDTTVGAVRAHLRAQLGLRGPVVLAGHQPEFFHAGVFAKYVAAHALAEAHGGTAVFLSADADLPKRNELPLPQTTSGGGLRRVVAAIPEIDMRRPFEFQPTLPRAQWLQFFASFASLHESYDRSLLRTFAQAWLTTEGGPPSYVDAFDRARAETEAALGLGGLRTLRVSALAERPAFRAFAAHLMLHAERCVEAYNAAQEAYRSRHRVRARGRPVPPLRMRGGAFELPLWIEKAERPRQRLFVVPRGAAVELRAEDAVVGTLSRDALATVAVHETPWALAAEGWVIRPRALALSAFVRLFVADLFIHGIGGAKYDEMMEEFIDPLLGTAPGPACCVSATVYPPLPARGVTPAAIRAAQRASRDLRFNPQRHVRDLPGELIQRRAELVRQSESLRTASPPDRAARRVVFREIRRVSAQMLERDPWRAAEYDRRVEQLQRQAEQDAIALDREYFFALHPRESLEQLITAVRGAVTDRAT